MRRKCFKIIGELGHAFAPELELYMLVQRVYIEKPIMWYSDSRNWGSFSLFPYSLPSVALDCLLQLPILLVIFIDKLALTLGH